MESLKQVNEDIRRYKIMVETTPQAQKELDRLYTKRDCLVLCSNLQPKAKVL